MSSRAERKKRNQEIEGLIKQIVIEGFEENEENFKSRNKNKESLDYLDHLQGIKKTFPIIIADKIHNRLPYNEIPFDQLKLRIEIATNLLVDPKINFLMKKLEEKGISVENSDLAGDYPFVNASDQNEKFSIAKILADKEKRLQLIQAKAWKWGFVVELNKAIIFFTDDPGEPHVINREEFLDKLIQEISALNYLSCQFFFMALGTSLKINASSEATHTEIDKIIDALKAEVEKVKIKGGVNEGKVALNTI